MDKVARDGTATLHIRPSNDRQITQKQTVRMQRGADLRGVHRHMLLGQLVATSDRPHSFHPGELNVLQRSGALQELGRSRIGEHVSMGARVDDHECGQTGDEQEETGQQPGTATDWGAGFTLDLCGFILRALRQTINHMNNYSLVEINRFKIK